MRVEENIVEWHGPGVVVRAWMRRDGIFSQVDYNALFHICRGYPFFELMNASPDPFHAADQITKMLGERCNALQVSFTGYQGVVIYPDWP